MCGNQCVWCVHACVRSCVCVCVQTCVQAWIPAQCSNCTCTMTGEHACTHEPRTPTLALAHTHKHARINARKAAPVCHGLCQLLHHQGSVYVLPSQQQPPPHRHVQRLHGRFEAFRLLPALPHADIPTERDRGYGRREGNKGRGKEEKDRAKGGRVHGGRTPEECRISTAMLIPVADVCVCVCARVCAHSTQTTVRASRDIRLRAGAGSGAAADCNSAPPPGPCVGAARCCGRELRASLANSTSRPTLPDRPAVTNARPATGEAEERRRGRRR